MSMVVSLSEDKLASVYVHSRLMIVDDVFTTPGSANINTRSMQVDSELNIAHDWMSMTQALRRKLWNMHTAGQGAQDDPAEAFKVWQWIIKENKRRQEENKNHNDQYVPVAPLVEFYYDAAVMVDKIDADYESVFYFDPGCHQCRVFFGVGN